MVMEGAEKQAGRLWDKFGMKEVVKEKCVGHHAGRYASYGSWKATSSLAKGKYRLRLSGGIPRARARLHSQRRRGARASTACN